MNDPSLLEYLVAPNVTERVLATNELVKQMKRQTETLYLALGGLYLDCADQELAAKLLALRFQADEVIKWLDMHRAALEGYGVKPEPVTESKAVVH